jgi:hypothetical protein
VCVCVAGNVLIISVCVYVAGNVLIISVSVWQVMF